MPTLIRIQLLMVLLCGSSAQAIFADISKFSGQGDAVSGSYVGSHQCVSCHEEQFKSWQGSHHDLAMQHANEKSVLGDFNNTSFDYFGTVSRFYKKDNQYFVKTDGPDGKLVDYAIAYTFGVFPLQQYLIEFPGGRYQALNIAWDTRSKKEGGQRWFHLYPDEQIKHNDELHWTGINQNWNYMCADCHSTNLHKNFELDSKSYDTTWSEIDVGCEACHGPASRHLNWADSERNVIENKGFSVAFNEREKISWVIDTETGNAKRQPSKQTNIEIEACAQCHSRRATIQPGARPEHALLDNFQLSLLTESLYHADGQIDGEVYVYGSFVQSKMYHAGVSCSDCHEPHSLKLRADGNALCGQCHLPDKYESTDHHLHEIDSEAGQCVNCHMPVKNYMIVDARRDHSIGIPRPDLSEKMGVPNACGQCHQDKSSVWLASRLEKQHGKPERKHYAEAIHAGRNDLPGAERLLSELIVDDDMPAIARATAVTLLPAYLSRQSVPALQTAVNDEHPLMGLGVANALEFIAEQNRLSFAYPLLYDDRKITRMLAGRSLQASSFDEMPNEGVDKFNTALDEYVKYQLFNADRPESLVNLANLYSQQQKSKFAEEFYKKAILLAPYYAPAYVNLADHYRGTGNDQYGEEILKDALLHVRDKSTINHTLGLLKVRQKKLDDAIEYLRLAAASPDTTERYVYVYAIALHSAGKTVKALDVLEKAQSLYSTNRDILNALISINKEHGNVEQAQNYENIRRRWSR